MMNRFFSFSFFFLIHKRNKLAIQIILQGGLETCINGKTYFILFSRILEEFLYVIYENYNVKNLQLHEVSCKNEKRACQ